MMHTTVVPHESVSRWGEPIENVQKKSGHLFHNKQMCMRRRYVPWWVGADATAAWKRIFTCHDSIVARGMVDSCHVDRFVVKIISVQALPYQLKVLIQKKERPCGCRCGLFVHPHFFCFSTAFGWSSNPVNLWSVYYVFLFDVVLGRPEYDCQYA